MEQELQKILAIPDLSLKRERIQELIHKYPSHYELYYVMGHMYSKQEYTHALEWFLKCFDKLPDYVETILDILKIYFDNYPISVILNFITKKMPSDTNHLIYQDGRIFTTLGAAYFKSKNIILAKKYLELAQKIMENSTNKDLIQYACLCNSIGKLNLDHHEYQKALYYYCKVIDLFLENSMRDKDILLTCLGNLSLAQLYVTDNSVFKEHKLYLSTINLFLENTKNYVHATCDKSQKIKIGYVSSDFENHAVSFFINPILNHHNFDQFEVYLFNHFNTDLNHTWYPSCINIVNIWNISPEEVADFIYKEKIHILIDLNGHTDKTRLDVFALKPAPIQISYCGFLNTTGLHTMDYYLTDSLAYDPVKNIQHFSEKILCMPYSSMVYAELFDLSNIHPKRTDLNTIVFGSLNTGNKVNTDVLNTWREILRQVPNSKIIIKDISLRGSIQFYQKILDIDISRIILHPRLKTTNEYYKLFEQIDISLDPFPYNGITTTCDALSCSIPVITYKNWERITHGMTASILEKCGLEELIAYSKEEYIAKAVKLAKSPARIDKYKKMIRPRFRKSMDPVDFMKKYEDLLLSVL